MSRKKLAELPLKIFFLFTWTHFFTFLIFKILNSILFPYVFILSCIGENQVVCGFNSCEHFLKQTFHYMLISILIVLFATWLQKPGKRKTIDRINAIMLNGHFPIPINSNERVALNLEQSSNMFLFDSFIFFLIIRECFVSNSAVTF